MELPDLSKAYSNLEEASKANWADLERLTPRGPALTKTWNLSLAGTWALIILSIAVAVPRVMGYKSQFYQGIAHIWVGGLFGYTFGTNNLLTKVLAWGLTGVEVICFLISRMG